MTRPLRIVAHNGASILGGGEIGTALLLAGLQRRGHDVLMLLRDETVAHRVAAYGIPTGVQRVGGDVMLHDAVRLASRLRSERPDAVILTTFKKVFLAGMGARLARVPFVVQRVVLQGDTPARGARYRYALRRSVDAVVLNAESMRPDFLAGDPGLDPGRVVTIVDGVAAPPLHAPAGAVRDALGIPADAFVVGSVARLARQKRFDRLLHALALLPPKVHCVIAGEGEELESLLSLAGELGLSQRVHLTGFRTDVGDILATFDVFVISSDREGLANAMLEAMWLGVPAVSTPVSGAHEALDAKPGSDAAGVVTDFDHRSLADVIGSLLADPQRLHTLGTAARSRAEQEFGAERFLDEWEGLLASGTRHR